MDQTCCNIPVPTCPGGARQEARSGLWARLPGELPASLTAGALLALGFITSYAPGAVGVGGLVLIWISLGIGMVYGGRAAWGALAARRFDIDVLMVLAAALAAMMGHPEDGALLLFLFTLAGALEARAMRRTMRAVEALSKLMPTRAMVWRSDAPEPEQALPDAMAKPSHGTGGWREVDPREVRVGERLWIRTGELVPCDARILEGSSTIDQATLTGESLPRAVEPGDEIYAGTINIGNPVEATAERPAEESSLQKILNLVISAQQQREPMQRIIDRLSEPYAVGVLVVSSLVLAIWWLALGFALVDAAYVAIALLIVASPCALIIATPTATLAAISRAARAGVLFKGGQSIERLARMGTVCLDKTGTLTLGRPQLQQVHPVGWSNGAEMLAAAAALESGSTHPIAVAVVEAARNRGARPEPVQDLQDLPGRGISGVIGGGGSGGGRGREGRLGTYEHCEGLIPICLRGRVRDVLEKVRMRGQIGVVVAVGGEGGGGQMGEALAAEGNEEHGRRGDQAAVLILSDTVRPGALELVDGLHELGVRPVRMLTGDNSMTAAHVAAQLGIDEWEAELLPQDKVRIMQAMRSPRRQSDSPGLFAMLAALTPAGSQRIARGVGVIGDGVNDAPALAAAYVSIAIGSIGSDAALETADIVLLNEDLTAVPWATSLARRTRSIVLFNIILALSIIVLMGALTLILTMWDVIMPLPAAVVAHEGGTLLVVLNSLRLLMVGGAGGGGADRPLTPGKGESPDEVLNHEGAAAELAA